MASLVARALTEDHPQGGRDPRAGIDRVLMAFWRPDPDAPPAPVISLSAHRPRVPTSR
jgi:hypothetical protein